MKTILLDTNILLFDALQPERLSRAAIKVLATAEQLACADVSLWEIAMLIGKKRLMIDRPAEEWMDDILVARSIKVLPITPAIATQSQRWPQHKDPADLVIAATAWVHQIPLLSSDTVLAQLPDIKVVW